MITQEVLAKTRKLLGPTAMYHILEGTDDDGYRTEELVRTSSDGDLLLAILNKAEELGQEPILSKTGPHWTFLLGVQSGISSTGATPIDVALLAFSQLEPP